MIVSCKAKKKQAVCDERVCYLQVAELVNAVNKRPYKAITYLLRTQLNNPTMEEIG